MKNLLKFIFKNSNNINSKNLQFEKIKFEKGASQIFDAIKEYSETSEVRYVGGCIRRILSNENVDDIDLATNLNPDEICKALEKKKINFYKTGYLHGTITANIGKIKFEITSLREDISTDGRRAVVKYSKDWNKDALRRDFTINAIYSDIDGNIFDPTNGKKDLEDGNVKFIGNVEERIKEDYLRIVRYVRFFLSYSKYDHEQNVKKVIKKNIQGIKRLSNERILGELKKIIKTKNFLKLLSDEFSKEILLLVIPQIINLDTLKNIKKDREELFNSKDTLFIIALLIIDDTDNTDFFLFKFNLSNLEKKRILFLKNHFIRLNDKSFFSEYNLLKIYYFYGIEYLIDLIDFKLLTSKIHNKKISNIKNLIVKKDKPILPIKAKDLIEKFNLKEGKDLGLKMKKIEETWIDNKFKISDSEIAGIARN